jgi:two-component system chemotaxis response regulator CheY
MSTRQLKILIADDDPVQRWILRTILSRSGHEVRETTNAQDAWTMLQDDSVQIMITNWIMPGMDGLSLIRQIRESRMDHYVYVIVLTACDTTREIVDGLEAGADDYLTKPFDPHELLARIGTSERILALEAHLRASRDHERKLAQHDSLTGLLNRRAIYEHAEAEIARATREGSPISLILLDIDHFKEVNDNYGHLIGDQALYLIAATIKHNKRPTDWFGRWGGEEFLLVLPNTSLDEARVVAERIRSSVAEARLPLTEGGSLRRTVSLGVSGAPGGGQPNLDVLLQQADTMLLLTKEAGRNQVGVYASEKTLLSHRRSI